MDVASPVGWKNEASAEAPHTCNPSKALHRFSLKGEPKAYLSLGVNLLNLRGLCYWFFTQHIIEDENR